MEPSNFLGLECNVLENSTLRLLVTRSVGPRVLSFGFKDGKNIFAELPDAMIDYPEGDGGEFHFYGGIVCGTRQRNRDVPIFQMILLWISCRLKMD